MKRLTLAVNGEYFDAMVVGEKTEEFRLFNEHWERRLWATTFDGVVITRGYPRGGGVLGRTRLEFPWRGFEVREMTHKHFGPAPVVVFAIRLTDVGGSL